MAPRRVPPAVGFRYQAWPQRAALAAAAVWLLGLLTLGTGRAQNSVLWTTNYYNVTGATLFDVHASLNAARPWRDKASLNAYTEWHVNWRFQLRQTSRGCRCSSLQTTTTIKMTMPRWTAPTNASEELRQTWKRYIDALGTHEAGHARIALAAAGEMHKRIKDLDPEPECSDAEKKIRQTVQEVLDDFGDRDKIYDQRTRHGITQGAFLGGRRHRRPPGAEP